MLNPESVILNLPAPQCGAWPGVQNLFRACLFQHLIKSIPESNSGSETRKRPMKQVQGMVQGDRKKIFTRGSGIKSFLMLLIAGVGFIFVLLSTNVFSAEKALQIKGPIIITSEMLTADNKTNTALFEHSVVARTTDMTMYADKMLVHYHKDTGDVTQIEATGNVKFTRGTRAITSYEAVFFSDENKIIFHGEPRAVEGENVLTGTKIIYLFNEDRFIVEDSKVFLIKKKGP